MTEQIPREYVSVDIETAGPAPSTHALLSIGACLVADPEQHFYIELQPTTMAEVPEASAIHGLSLPYLLEVGAPPADAMAAFEAWVLAAVPSKRPVFVAWNAPFDWMFVCDYFARFLGRNPFGHAALDIKAYYMALQGVPWSRTSMADCTEHLGERRTLSHHALQDARDQGEIFRRLLEQRWVTNGEGLA
jgi:ribonuclease T